MSHNGYILVEIKRQCLKNGLLVLPITWEEVATCMFINKSMKKTKKHLFDLTNIHFSA